MEPSQTFNYGWDIFQNHIDHPMSLLDLRLRQGGRYAHYSFDMDGTSTSSTVFSDFYRPGSRHFRSADDRLGAVHKAANRHRHASLCRSAGGSSPRRLSSVSAGCAMGHASPVADAGPVADSNLRPQGQLRRCDGVSASPALAGTNKIDVRKFGRT